MKQCTVDGCGRDEKARGYCGLHYTRQAKHGDVHYTRPRQTTSERFWSKVDKSGECWTWTASVTERGYGQFNPGGRSDPKQAHRVSWEMAHGSIPEGLVIDHICFTRLCVNPSHLRATTLQLNSEYRHRGKKRFPASGHRGVYRTGSKWTAKVTHNRTAHHLGRYEDKEEAARAAAEKRRELFTFPEYQEEKRTA